MWIRNPYEFYQSAIISFFIMIKVGLPGEATITPATIHNQDDKNINLMEKSQKDSKRQMMHSQSSNHMESPELEQIRSQKLTILNELRHVNAAIDTVKTQQRSKSILRRRQQISNDKQARKQAISFINHQKIKKKELEDRRKAQESRIVSQLKEKVEEQSKERMKYETILREQRRRAISIRINQAKAKRDQLNSIEKQSNLLINKLIRQEEDIRKKIESPNKVQEVPIKIIEKRPHVSFLELQKHEQEYLLRKQQLAKKKQRSISISYPIKRFQKNKWAEKLDEQENKIKEQERIKSLEKRMRIQKRVKYGELINSLFLKKNKVKTDPFQQNSPVINSKSIYVMPNKKISKLITAKTESFESVQKKQKRKKIKNQYNCTNRYDLSPEDLEKQQQKLGRQKQIRKETSERLKKIESSIIQKTISEPEPKYQSQYQNYLGQVRLKKKEEGHTWNNILNNSDMTKEQKYNELIMNAAKFENKAKLKESLKEDRDEVVDLYLNSIQVKLAILQSI